MPDVCALSATELVHLYGVKELSPVDATSEVLERIEKLNPVVNAFNLVSERALKDAKESEARWFRGEPKGLLDGVPVSIKDLLLTKGWPTLRGSKTTDPAGPWNDDAPAVARLREHGAVLVGKTTTPEFGWKGVTDSPLTGITRNPWNPQKTAGGSSGGAAAALAAGMGPLALGTDAGGSIRIPCSFTGLFGLKPSFGRVPAWPASPLSAISHVGPMARNVTDAALMMNVLAQPDARDGQALPYDSRDYLAGVDLGVRKMRIAYSGDLGYAKVDPEIARLVRDAVRVFEALGASVEESQPGFEDPEPMFRTQWYASAAFLLRRIEGDERRLVDPGLLEVASKGAEISTAELVDAQMKRLALGTHMSVFHLDYDLLLTPTLSIAAFDADKSVADSMLDSRWVEWTPFAFPFNLTQQPAASVPCGVTKAGLPVGLHIVGPRGADALVLRAARAYERVRPAAAPDLSSLF